METFLFKNTMPKAYLSVNKRDFDSVSFNKALSFINLKIMNIYLTYHKPSTKYNQSILEGTDIAFFLYTNKHKFGKGQYTEFQYFKDHNIPCFALYMPISIPRINVYSFNMDVLYDSNYQIYAQIMDMHNVTDEFLEIYRKSYFELGLQPQDAVTEVNMMHLLL